MTQNAAWDMLVVLFNDIVLNQGEAFLDKYRTGQVKALHSLEALHLASAMIARRTLPESVRTEMIFVSVDKQLRGCAQGEGFAVIDPKHPPGA